MMRGQKTLYTSLFPTSITVQPENKSKRNVYIENRRDKIASRYYFYAQIRRIRYDDCLVELASEFDLSPSSVTQDITKRIDFIKALISAKTTAADLRKKYPYFNWI